MELRQLRYFVAIVDHGSLSRAALALHVAQPALTQQLRQLEDELGVQLLHRSAQGMLSNDAGRIFYEHAQAILKQVADARSAVVQSAERPSGSVTLGLPHSISGALALPLLTAARARYPEISLQLTEELTGNLNEQLRSGRVNLAVLFDDGQLGQFATTPLVEEELRFICRTDAAYARGAPALTLRTAVGATLILPGLQHGESVLRAAGLALSSVIEINSITILKSALLADLGATILPAAPVLDELQRGTLRAQAIHEPSLSRTVVLCASKNIPLTNAAQAVGALVRSVCGELCARGAWPGAAVIDG
jgi:LysR family nitrogen assimilation transcriptional regulator